jgi:hypothetical protein
MDPFTMTMRLCDDHGNVSDAPAGSPAAVAAARELGRPETYLDRLNRLRALTRVRDRLEPVSQSFVCTGSAHLAGEHIRCTSPAHDLKPAHVTIASVPGVLISAIQTGEPISGWHVGPAWPLWPVAVAGSA